MIGQGIEVLAGEVFGIPNAGIRTSAWRLSSLRL
jgi:hypothetical protein